MCGLVGFASTTGSNNRQLKKEYIRQGLMFDAIRGMESTGIAVVQDPAKPPFVYKKALSGPDFINMGGPFDRIMFDIEKFPIVLGHNRASTRGQISDYNAHPFQYGNITLVHNGHVHNADSLPNSKEADCAVDSAKVAYSMFKNGEMETLEQIQGAYVLVWWNSQTQKLNIARNEKRPLWLGYIDKENTMVWASEAYMLAWLVDRNGGTLEDETVIYPEMSTWYKYDLKDLRKIEKVPFVTSHGRQNQQSRNHNYKDHGTANTSGTGIEEMVEDLEAWEAEAQTYDTWRRESENQTTGKIPTSPATKEDVSSLASELDEIRETLANQRDKDANQLGVPTSKKKVAWATKQLSKHGIKYRQLMICVPQSWTKYKNQDRLGSLLARSRDGNHNIQVIGVDQEDFGKFHQRGVILVDITNLRRDAEGHTYLTGTLSPKMAKIMAKVAEKELLQESQTQPEVELIYDGPGGRQISLNRFLDLVKNGCCWCSGSIHASQHNLILWGNGGDPVCQECSSDATVLKQIGMYSSIADSKAEAGALH